MSWDATNHISHLREKGRSDSLDDEMQQHGVEGTGETKNNKDTWHGDLDLGTDCPAVIMTISW